MAAEAPDGTLSPQQLTALYERIRLPQQHRHLPGAALTAVQSSQTASLAFLAALQRHCVAALPFENLSLHYDLHHVVHLAPAYVFEKMVARGAGRGGYCMELNGLLAAVLRALGFAVAAHGAKVNESVFADDHSAPRAGLAYAGWNHMVLVVALPADAPGEQPPARFLVDIGFGGGNPTAPLPLRHGAEMVNIPGSEDGEGRPHMLRLSRERVGGNDGWVLDRLVQRAGMAEGGEYRPFYFFTETQFSAVDFEILNHHVATSKRSFFTYAIIAVRSVLSEDGERVIGDVVLFEDGVKRREFGKTVMQKKLKNEDERVQALDECFGIKLSAVERGAIRGMVSMIKPQ